MAVNERNSDGVNGGAERDPALERLYHEAAAETPPAQLDAAILAAARREVDARPRPISPMLRRWHVPVSIAALVVVSVTLVILAREEGGMALRDYRVADVDREQMSAPGLPTQAAEEGVPKRSAPPAAAAPEPLRPESRDDMRRARAFDKLEEGALREPIRSNVPSREAVEKPETTELQSPRILKMEAAAPQAAETPAAPASAGAVTAGKAAAPAAPGEPLAARPASEALRQARPVEGVAAARIAGQDRPPVWHAFEKEPPEKWLAHIEELRKQGRTADADEMLSEFRRRFPSHPVPPTPSR